MPLAWPEERVIHDDGSILAVCKPHGMIVHGGADTPAGDLLSCLQSRCHGRRLRVCSTLERGASGIVLLSYTDAARRELMERFEPEQWILTYHVAVSDPGLPSHGVLPPARNHTTRGAHGRFTVLERSEGRALLEVELRGPTPHSLRESLANLRAPVCGDVEHGGRRAYSSSSSESPFFS